MKNLFAASALAEVNSRLERLQPDSPRQWGKMNAGQMLAHCSAALKVATGQAHPPQLLIGKLIGRFFKKDFLNEKPFAKNSPTEKTFVFTDERDFTREKEQLQSLILQFHQGGPAACTNHPHSFFGRLKPEEWAVGMYKHLDHHFRQFGV